MNQSPSTPTADPFDRSLLDEPAYAVALDELLAGLEAGQGAAYETVARRYPRYAAPLLEAALIALPAERRLQQDGANVVREASAGYTVRQAVADGIASARRALE